MNNSNNSIRPNNQEVLRKHIWHALLYEYHKGASVNEAWRNIHKLYGDCVSIFTIETWYKSFEESNSNIELATSKKTPENSIFQDPKVTDFIKKNPEMPLDEMAQILSIDINMLTDYKIQCSNGSDTKNKKRKQESTFRPILMRPVSIPQYQPPPGLSHKHYNQYLPFNKFSAYPAQEEAPEPKNHLLDKLLGKPYKQKKGNSVLDKLLSESEPKQNK